MTLAEQLVLREMANTGMTAVSPENPRLGRSMAYPRRSVATHQGSRCTPFPSIGDGLSQLLLCIATLFAGLSNGKGLRWFILTRVADMFT
jgi:hypothetical protein